MRLSRFKPRHRTDPTARRLFRPQLESLEPRNLLASDPVISEFMAVNDSTLADGDGAFSDWIEINNRGDQTVPLPHYHFYRKVSLMFVTFRVGLLMPTKRCFTLVFTGTTRDSGIGIDCFWDE